MGMEEGMQRILASPAAPAADPWACCQVGCVVSEQVVPSWLVLVQAGHAWVGVGAGWPRDLMPFQRQQKAHHHLLLMQLLELVMAWAGSD